VETESVQPHPVAGGQDLLLGDHPLIQGDLQLLPQRLRELDRRLRNLPGSFDLTDPNQVVDPPTDQCSVISAGLYFQMETVTVTSLIRLNQVNKTTANEGRPAYGTLGKSLRRRRRSSGSVSLRPSCSAPSLIPSPCRTLVSPETSPRHPVPASWPAYATTTSATPMMGQPQERGVSQWPSRRLLHAQAPTM